jgi:hypothetical protein
MRHGAHDPVALVVEAVQVQLNFPVVGGNVDSLLLSPMTLTSCACAWCAFSLSLSRCASNL